MCGVPLKGAGVQVCGQAGGKAWSPKAALQNLGVRTKVAHMKGDSVSLGSLFFKVDILLKVIILL